MKSNLRHLGPFRAAIATFVALSVVLTLLTLGVTEIAFAQEEKGECRETGYSRPGQYTLYCRIPMLDGATLAATVFLLEKGKSFPIVLRMTPYGRPKARPGWSAVKLSHGYGFVDVDVRGTGGSTGALCVFCPREHQDVFDTVGWIASQTWSNQSVGMMGSSYAGITALLGAATKPAALKVVVPLHSYSDLYRDAVWQNGLFNTGLAPQWSTFQALMGATGRWEAPSKPSDRPGATELADAVANDPTITTDRTKSAVFTDARLQEHDGPFYTERSVYPRYGDIEIPVVSVGGWLDGFSRGTVKNFQGVASEQKRLFMQPFGHHDGTKSDLGADWEPLNPHLGPQSETGHDTYEDDYALYREIIHDAFDRYLKDDDTHSWIFHEELSKKTEHPMIPMKDFLATMDVDAPVIYYDMGYRGRKGWKTADTWPPAGSEVRTLYLSGDEPAGAASSERGSLMNDGSLQTAAPGPDGGWDTYVYDPTQGVTETFSKWGEIAATPQVRAGERGEEVRALTYTTPPLEEPLELAGPMELRFYATTTAKDMDWVVKVSDVAPKGKSCTNLSEGDIAGNSCLMTSGYLKASHRGVDESRSGPAEPWIVNVAPAEVPNGAIDKKPVEYRVDVWPTAWTIQPGHRLRVTIMSSDVPSHEPSPYAGVNEIFHNADYPSRLLVTHIPYGVPEVALDVSPNEVTGYGPISVSATVSDVEGVADIASIDLALSDEHGRVLAHWSRDSFQARGDGELGLLAKGIKLSGPSPWTVTLISTDSDGASASATSTVVRIDEEESNEEDEDPADESGRTPQ